MWLNLVMQSSKSKIDIRIRGDITSVVESTISFTKKIVQKKEVVCYKCHRNGHFAKLCKTKLKHVNFKKRPNKNKVLVDIDDSDDEDNVFIVNAEKQVFSIAVKIKGVLTDIIIDSGTTCNLRCSRKFHKRNFSSKNFCHDRIHCCGRICTEFSG